MSSVNKLATDPQYPSAECETEVAENTQIRSEGRISFPYDVGMSVDFLRIAHELVGIGSYVINLRTRILYGSHELSLLLQCGDKPMIMNYDEYRRRFYVPDDYERVTQIFNSDYSAGRPVQLDTRLVRSDGEIIWVRTASVQRINNEGDPVRVGMLRDITQNKLAEDALNESEKRFRTAFMTSAIAFVIVEEMTGILLEVNEHFLMMYGYEKSEVIGKTSIELGMWAFPEERKRLLQLLQQNNRVDSYEVLAQKKNGEKFWVTYSVNRLPTSKSSTMLGAILDITEQKYAEEKINKYIKDLAGC